MTLHDGGQKKGYHVSETAFQRQCFNHGRHSLRSCRYAAATDRQEKLSRRRHWPNTFQELGEPSELSIMSAEFSYYQRHPYG
jgi:hypothetical protein